MQFEKNCDILNDALCRGVCGRVHNFFERICNMGVFDYIIGGLLLLMAVFLVVAIMLQSGKGKGLSGTIAGGSGDSYYGKNKGRTRDQMLSRLTTVVAIVFVVLVLLLYIFQGKIGGTQSTSSTAGTSSQTSSVASSDASDDESEEAESESSEESSGDVSAEESAESEAASDSAESAEE